MKLAALAGTTALALAALAPSASADTFTTEVGSSAQVATFTDSSGGSGTAFAVTPHPAWQNDLSTWISSSEDREVEADSVTFSQAVTLPAGTRSLTVRVRADNGYVLGLGGSTVADRSSVTLGECQGSFGAPAPDSVTVPASAGATTLSFVVDNCREFGAPANPLGLNFVATATSCNGAAPSIVSALLKAAGIKSGSSTAKNVVSRAAALTGGSETATGPDGFGNDPCVAGYVQKVTDWFDAQPEVVAARG